MDQATVIKCAIRVLSLGNEDGPIGGWAAIIAAGEILKMADAVLREEFNKPPIAPDGQKEVTEQ